MIECRGAGDFWREMREQREERRERRWTQENRMSGRSESAAAACVIGGGGPS